MVDIDRLIEASSLGTRAARQLRRRTTPAQVEGILRHVRNQAAPDPVDGDPLQAVAGVPEAATTLTTQPGDHPAS